MVVSTRVALGAPDGLPNTWTAVAQLPTGMLWPAAATANGKLYVFCNRDPCGTTVEAYDPQTNAWTSEGTMAPVGGLLSATAGPDGRIYLYGYGMTWVYDPQTGAWGQAPPPPGVDEFAILVTGRDGRIYAVGGRANNVAVGALSAYDPSTNTWTSLTPDPTPQDQGAAAVGPDGHIYVIGGTQSEDTVEAYDPQSNTWTSVASLPTPRAGLQAVTGPDGRIYALGGSGRCFTAPCDEVEAYDVRTNTWTAVASMPHGRADFAAAAGPDGRIYVLGGETTPYDVQTASQPTEVDAYTVVPSDQPLPAPPPEPTIATSELAPMPVGRDVLGATTADGKIYAIGGDQPIGSPIAQSLPAKVLTTVEAYDPKTNTWATEPSLPEPRMKMGVTTGLDGRIYVLGGVAAQPAPDANSIVGLPTVFIYDPRTRRWSRGEPMPDGRYGLAAVTGKDGRIYTIGGGTECYNDEGCDGTQTVRAFNPRTNTWRTLAPLHAGLFLSTAAVGPDGRIYAFGGDNPLGNSFEVYDPAKNRWTKVKGIPHIRDQAFAAATDGNGRIDLIGGCLSFNAGPTGMNDDYDVCGDPSPVDQYNPRTSRWTSIGVTLNARQGLAATTGPDGRVYAVGGVGYGNGRLLEVIRERSGGSANGR